MPIATYYNIVIFILFRFQQEFWEAHMAINVPSLKMLKRQLRNFRTGYSATVTLVFQATQPVSVRWFRTDARLVNSEMPNMIPVEGEYSILSLIESIFEIESLFESRRRYWVILISLFKSS